MTQQNINEIVPENIYSSTTLNIIQASKFLGAHKETVRRLVASGNLPGVKIGRSWRFIVEDLVNHMRAQYTIKNEQSSIDIRSSNKWPLQKEITSGGLTSHTKEIEYVKVLGLM